MLVKKSSIIQYIFLYIVLVSCGSVKSAEYHDLFIVASLSLFLIVALKNIKRLKKDQNLLFIFGLTLLALLEIVITENSFTILNALYIISLYGMVYAAYMIDPRNALTRYVKLVLVLAEISLIMYTVSLSPYSSLLEIMGRNNQNYMTRVSYGGWIYHYMVGYPRNPGIFTEPGLYQMILLTALYLLLFRENRIDISSGKRKYAILILVTTLISAQSTTGYIGLCGLVAVYLFFSERDTAKKSVWIIVAVGVSVILIEYNLNGENSILYKTVLDKLFDSSMKINISDNTGNARIQCMIADMKLFLDHPLGLGYERYLPVWKNYLAYEIFSDYSSVGITKTLATCGIILTGYMLTLYVKNTYINRKEIAAWVAFIIIYLNTIIAQPAIYFGCFTLVCFDCLRVKAENNYEEI